MTRSRLERALEVVDHRQQLLDEPLRGARDQICLVARDPLAVVVELGLQPLERVEVLVPLARHRRERVDVLRRRRSSSTGGSSIERSTAASSLSALVGQEVLASFLVVHHLVVGVLDHLVVRAHCDAPSPDGPVDADA